MNELITLAVDSSEKRGLTLILTQDKARESKTDLIANLILKGPLFVLSGDEWFPAFVLRTAARQDHRNQSHCLSLRLVRASTCYRLFHSLATYDLKGEPILLMDFLHTFYDDDIPLRTRSFFKSRECCRELMRLELYSPVIVMTQEREGEEYEKFIPLFSSCR